MLECFYRGEKPGCLRRLRGYHPPVNGSFAPPPLLTRKAQVWADLQLDDQGNPIGDVPLLKRKVQAWADLKIEEEEEEEWMQS